MLLARRTDQALRRAAAPALARIRRDRRRALGARPVLDYLKHHLFDPQLSIQRLLRDSGLARSTVKRLFRSELGTTVRDYVQDLRYEVAIKLLRDTDLRLYEVARLVGIRHRVFANAFRRRFGLPPGAYREKHRAETSPPAPSPEEEEPLSVELLVQALANQLEPDRLRVVLGRLRTLHARALGERKTAEPPPTLDGRKAEEVLAELQWRRLEALPPAERRATIRREAKHLPAMLVDVLWRLSREIGRMHQQQGVELAELALEGARAGLGGERPGTLARAWARAGNARRLAQDLSGAERAFENAWAAFNEYPEPNRLLEAEICDLEACLRTYQRHFALALKLQNRALQRLSSEEDKLKIAKALIQKASIIIYAGRPAEAVGVLRQVRELVRGRDGALELTATHNLAIAHELADQDQQAEAEARRALTLRPPVPHLAARLQIHWLQARLARRRGDDELAVRCFWKAYGGFLALDESDYRAMIGLDLATLFIELGLTRDAVALITESLETFTALDLGRDMIAAFKLLLHALEDAEDVEAAMRSARVHLERLRLEPRIHVLG